MTEPIEYPTRPGECLFTGGHIYGPGLNICPRCGRDRDNPTGRPIAPDAIDPPTDPPTAPIGPHD